MDREYDSHCIFASYDFTKIILSARDAERTSRGEDQKNRRRSKGRRYRRVGL